MVLLTAFGCLLFGGCEITNPPTPTTQPVPQAVRAASRPEILEEKWGIEIVWVKSSAAGYCLDFRYRVLDPVKARPILARSAKRYLVDQNTGAKMLIPTSPKVGAMRQTTRKPVAGRVYFIIFSNPRKIVKVGDKVTVVIGDCHAENIVVR